ncbi:MAG: ATP-binding protein [Bacteroidales bacterium]|nr:ATP-binding protein [Bacteroidales bacterium]
MQYIQRIESARIKKYLENFPAVAILGPRQCGKSTLAKYLLRDYPEALFLDLENPEDRIKLTDPGLFFNLHKGKLICLDEIQRVPELFQVLRSVIDANNRNGQFLILGSASRELISQSSESLAGRLIYQELTPFQYIEIESDSLFGFQLRGGFPRSFLAVDDEMSFQWRRSFISTFLERDLALLGFGYPPETMRNLWMMCAHQQGQLSNLSRLGQSLGVSHTSVRSYIDLLTETYMLRILQPFKTNTGKRVVKTPKVYLRDTGTLHALLNIRSLEDLLGHPVFGASWETIVIEQLLVRWEGDFGFYRTPAGAEIDLVLEKNGKLIAIECKASTVPTVGREFYSALEDLQIDAAIIVAPVGVKYPLKKGVWVMPLTDAIHELFPPAEQD